MSAARRERGTTVDVKRMRARAWLLGALLVTIGLVGAAPAAQADVVWRINAMTNTTAVSGGLVTFSVFVRDDGTSDTDGSTVSTTVTLPTGLTAVSAGGSNSGFGSLPCTAGNGDPQIAGAQTIQCDTSEFVPDILDGGSSFTPTYSIVASVDGGVPDGTKLTSTFGVSGGGASQPASTVAVVKVGSPPPFGVANLDNAVTADAAGDPFTQAGGHPYAATASIDFNTVHNPLPIIGDLWPVEPAKDVIADLPAGFVGGTAGVDQCTIAELSNSGGTLSLPRCPVGSQVGSTLVRVNGFDGTFAPLLGPIPVFNMVAPPGSPAEFGFNALGAVVTLTARVRTASDYGLSVDAQNISEGLAVASTSLTFWGVPSDPSHDAERGCPGQAAPWATGPTCTSDARPSALLRNPTSCVAPASSATQDGLVTNLSVDSWLHPGARDVNGAPLTGDPSWKTASVVSHGGLGYPYAQEDFGPHLLPTGCDKLPFDPTFTLQPSVPARAGMPTGLQVDLGLPQTSDPTSIGESDLKQAVVTLPAGMHVSPSAANNRGACSPEQISLHSSTDPTCPDSSKVGTLQITTPLIDQKLNGSVFLATPNDNPFHSLLAIYLVAQGAGVTVKLAGHVEADPNSGQLTTTFDDNPQVPFTNLHLDFFSGARAALAAPDACGTYTTHAELTPWARPDQPVGVDSTFTVDQNSDGSACAPPGFSPGFDAGNASPDAGKHTSFLMRLTHDDGDQQLSTLKVDTPTGLLGTIANTVLCPDTAANLGACQPVSKVGDVTVGAGPGPDPFYITTGQAFITGPYKGAPYGLAITIPAVAGPFDLGTVVVRATVGVDRHTAQLHVVSDPFPTILQGIPLDVRDVRVAIDRPNFIVNPTRCVSKSVQATIGSTAGAIVHRSAHFQAANCATLPLSPKFTLTVGSRHHTQAGVSTPLTATLTQTPGQSNLRSVSVALPGTLNALLPVVNRACTLTAFDAGHCGNRAKVGTAVAVTPLLRDPLRGSVYFVKNPARTLPDLMVALRGQVALDLTGKISIPGGKRLATRFDTIPDAPITRFTLHIVSGANGPVGIATSLCSAKGRAATAAIGIRGQNNALIQTSQRLHIVGCPTAARARRSQRTRR